MEIECEVCEYPLEVDHKSGDRYIRCPACGTCWNVTARTRSFLSYEIRTTRPPVPEIQE